MIRSMHVDIAIPYYGDPSLLYAAVRSVLAQDDPHWRLTVVDDGDAPGVPGWFTALGDARVRYLRNARNLGVTGNFNRCLDLLDHDLAVLLGCDDLLHPHYVRTVRGVFADHPEAGFVQPGVRVIDRHGRPTRTLVDTAKRLLYAPSARGRRVMGGEELAVSLLRGDWLYFPSLCFRTEALTPLRFRADLRVIQDLALLLELVLGGANLVVDDTVCFDYRRHAASESSATAAAGSRFTEAGAFFAETARTMRAHGWRHAARVSSWHVSSRLFALATLPTARTAAGIRALLGHALR
jgi:glycosyltransferase involved in cell wall biosynthesis